MNFPDLWAVATFGAVGGAVGVMAVFRLIRSWW